MRRTKNTTAIFFSLCSLCVRWPEPNAFTVLMYNYEVHESCNSKKGKIRFTYVRICFIAVFLGWWEILFATSSRYACCESFCVCVCIRVPADWKWRRRCFRHFSCILNGHICAAGGRPVQCSVFAMVVFALILPFQFNAAQHHSNWFSTLLRLPEPKIRHECTERQTM